MTENRETFFKRLEPFFAPGTLNDVELAYMLAKAGHQYQTRKEVDPTTGEPLRYFEHVRRAALVLIDEVKIVRSEMIIAALLHDAIEDTRYIQPRMIEHCFGPDVCCLVKTLSKAPSEGYLDRFYMATDWRPYVLKACDRLDNLRSLATGGYAFRIKQVQETREKYFPLFDRMLTLASDEYKSRVQWVRDAVRQETERQATLLETMQHT